MPSKPESGLLSPELCALYHRGWRELRSTDARHAQWKVGGEGELIQGYRSLRVWTDPSPGDDPTSWTTFQPDDGADLAMAREVVWQRSHDWRRFDNWSADPAKPFETSPTISVRRANVSMRTLTDLILQAAAIRVPITAMRDGRSVTSDAGSEGVEIFSADDPPAILSFQWSWELPEGWRPFAEWAVELMRILKGCVWSERE